MLIVFLKYFIVIRKVSVYLNVRIWNSSSDIVIMFIFLLCKCYVNSDGKYY